MNQEKNEVSLQLTEEFAFYLCSYFIGVAMVKLDPERSRLGGKNFIICYRVLSVEKRGMLRDMVRELKSDPQSYLKQMGEDIADSADNEDFINIIKNSDL